MSISVNLFNAYFCMRSKHATKFILCISNINKNPNFFWVIVFQKKNELITSGKSYYWVCWVGEQDSQGGVYSWGTEQTQRLLATWRFLISFHTWWNGSGKWIWWFMRRRRLGLGSTASWFHQEEVSSKAPFKSEFLHLMKSPSWAELWLHPPICGQTQAETSLPTGSLSCFQYWSSSPERQR